MRFFYIYNQVLRSSARSVDVPTYRVIKIKKHCNIAIIEYDATITLLYRDNNTTNKLHHIHQ